MCGRFSLAIDTQHIKVRFQASNLQEGWHPRYNIAPSQMCATVIEDEDRRLIVPMSWGLIPHWSKSKDMAYQLINARAETIKSKPSFRDSFRRKRCLVPADGFFEWKKSAKGKIPFRATLKSGELFAFAGLWDIWLDESQKEIKSFTIITTNANTLMERIHNRMPVILRKEDEAYWLNSAMDDMDKLESFLKPYPAKEMKIYQVPQSVNSWKNDNPECIEPVTLMDL